MKKHILPLLCALLLALTLPAQAEFTDHPLLRYRDAGPCRSLTGSIRVVVVFVDVPGALWTPEARSAAQAMLQSAASTLQREAVDAGVPLQLSFNLHNGSADALPDLSASLPWAKAAMASTGAAPLCAGSAADSVYCTGGMPIMFLLNTGGRNFSCMSGNSRVEEYSVLYASTMDAGYVRHELLHLYGAMDYYQNAACEQAAEALYPDSIMLRTRGDSTVDSLTAYIIGWADAPDAAAVDFLRRTAEVTGEAMAAARDADTRTGSAGTSSDGITYTGDLVDGERHGYGTLRWPTGDSYTGEFRHGERTGAGVYRWANGEVYTGDFADGLFDGTGVYVMADGVRYTGDFVRDSFHGTCVIEWSDSGLRYMGDVTNGEITGHGTFVFPDGTTYTGGVLNGMRHGQGIMRWSDGEMYMGGFEQDMRSGYGVYFFADGTSVAGQWAQDAFVE